MSVSCIRAFHHPGELAGDDGLFDDCLFDDRDSHV